MYRSVVVFCVLLIASALLSIPSSPNRVGPNGLRQGQWTVLLDMNWHAVKDQQNASYYRIINYIDGKPSGLVHTYTMLGKLRFEGYLRQEDPAVFGDGKATFYDDFGVKTSEGTYSGGMKNGLWAEWYEDGTYARGNYTNGVAGGRWNIFAADGRKLAWGDYLNGEREGYWVENDLDGKRREGTYRSGKYDGLWTFYYTNGQKESEGGYSQGKLNGHWTFWDEKGKKVGESRFRDGEKAE